jgi:Zn-finger nucleic acid-binding protein
MDCPNCRAAMATQTVEAQGGTLPIDACAACSVFWFDSLEDVRLTSKAVIGLFRYIGTAAATHRPLASTLACPRCRHTLAFTHDVMRTTRFTYWRCPDAHGKLITFTQFLAEKNFLRPPSPDELARLKESMRQIACSQCGAPVDLRSESACSHCGAPITLIDPDGVAKALQELGNSAAAAAPPASTMGSRLSDAQIDALFDAQRMSDRNERTDLLAVGVAAVGALLGSWLRS